MKARFDPAQQSRSGKGKNSLKMEDTMTTLTDAETKKP